MRSNAILVMTIVSMFVITNVASAVIDIEFVTIGNAGNAADSTGFGAVGYDYYIGKYEISNDQWDQFTAAAGAPTGNPASAYDQGSYYSYKGDQIPTDSVSWYEALQFANYLTSGDKSQGVYQFSGNNSNPGDFVGIDRAAAEVSYGVIYFLPSEDEWYKAAYYKSDASGYSLYANGTDMIPTTSQSNYGQVFPYDGPWDVGTGAPEQNGTFDMMGNDWEWTETIDTLPIVRGGSFYGTDASGLASTGRFDDHFDYEDFNLGFRVAMIPEPATVLLLCLGVALMRKR
ncbi:formylglycine-generating enzyme family protein [Planctomycetota bacterium]